MPGATPVFGLPYPLASDPVDPNAFLALAAAIDLAMSGIAQERDALVQKPILEAFNTGTQVIVSGVDTAILWNEVTDTHAMMAPGPQSTVVCQVAGVYRISLWSAEIIGYAGGSLVQANWRFFVNGVEIPSHEKKRPTSSSTGDTPSADTSVLYPLNIGDTVQVRLFFNATGNATVIGTALAMSLICPLA